MGFLREGTNYRAPVRWYPGGPQSEIEYYFADPNAEYFQDKHLYFPLLFLRGVEQDSLGELTGPRRRRFWNGRWDGKPPGRRHVGTEADFSGLTPYPGPTSEDQLPNCDAEGSASSSTPEEYSSVVDYGSDGSESYGSDDAGSEIYGSDSEGSGSGSGPDIIDCECDGEMGIVYTASAFPLGAARQWRFKIQGFRLIPPWVSSDTIERTYTVDHLVDNTWVNTAVPDALYLTHFESSGWLLALLRPLGDMVYYRCSSSDALSGMRFVRETANADPLQPFPDELILCPVCVPVEPYDYDSDSTGNESGSDAGSEPECGSDDYGSDGYGSDSTGSESGSEGSTPPEEPPVILYGLCPFCVEGQPAQWKIPPVAFGFEAGYGGDPLAVGDVVCPLALECSYIVGSPTVFWRIDYDGPGGTWLQLSDSGKNVYYKNFSPGCRGPMTFTFVSADPGFLTSYPATITCTEI